MTASSGRQRLPKRKPGGGVREEALRCRPLTTARRAGGGAKLTALGAGYFLCAMTVNGYQLYSAADLERLHFIQRARKLGFSVAEIRDILAHADQGDSPCPLVRDLLAHRLPQIRARIAELEALAERMEQALESWRDMPDGTPDGHSLCRLIESFPEEAPCSTTPSKP